MCALCQTATVGDASAPDALLTPAPPTSRLAWLSRACDQATDKVSEALVTKKTRGKKQEM